jgi:transposase
MKQDRFDHSVDHSDVTKPVRPQRIEVITSVERRRRWPLARKLEIVAESFQSGRQVSEVARRHGISPQQLFGWRAQLRAEVDGQAVIEAPLFAPALVDAAMLASVPAHQTQPSQAPHSPDPAPTIEITLGRAMVKLRGAVDPETLAVILKALKGGR